MRKANTRRSLIKSGSTRFRNRTKFYVYLEQAELERLRKRANRERKSISGTARALLLKALEQIDFIEKLPGSRAIKQENI